VLFHSAALQLWVLKACQTMTGLRDKPGKPPDYYHTCYCLSGLSAAQHAEGAVALGDSDNLLVKADPLVNVVEGQLAAMRSYFKEQQART
jgi:protein farnesyltransferase subunit beta